MLKLGCKIKMFDLKEIEKTREKVKDREISGCLVQLFRRFTEISDLFDQTLLHNNNTL